MSRKAYTCPLVVTRLRFVSLPAFAGFTDTRPPRTLTIQTSLSPQVASTTSSPSGKTMSVV